MRKSIEGIKLVCFILIFVLLFSLFQRLLFPKFASEALEGNMTAEYYAEENKDFDVLFLGDCEVYENYSPAELWKEYGIHSYIRGNAEQYIWQSYYMLEDTLRYHKPQVVVFNILSLQYNESESEPYNRMTIDGMKWTQSKVDSIHASMREDEKFLDYVFPFFRYHSRWNQLSMDDLTYYFEPKHVAQNGYLMRVDTKPAENVPAGRPLADYSFGDNAWAYLDQMRALCEQEGIQLILVKAPSIFPYWYPEWDEQLVAYSEKTGVPYYNFIDQAEEIGIDYMTDTFDAGQHLNLVGAEKLSSYIGNILSKDYAVPDRRSDEALAAVWEKKLQAYEEEVVRLAEKNQVDLSTLNR